MSIVVVGGGAIGMLIAGRLAGSGQSTALLGRPAGTAVIRERGLQIRYQEDVQQIKTLLAVSEPAELPKALRQPALVVLAVKAYDTAGALAVLRALDPQLILTVQNGLGNEELLCSEFGAARVLAGVITSSVEVGDAGQILVTKAGGIGLAPLDGVQRESGQAELFRNAGFLVREYADYRAMKWSKALLNMLGNASSAILDLPVAAIYADKRLFGLERRVLLEALAVMDRLRIRPVNLPRYPAALLALAVRRLPPPVLQPALRRMVAGGRGGKMPSLHIDLARGRKLSEGRYLYGAVAEAAARLGLLAPVNAALWQTLQAIIEGRADWQAYQQQPQRLLAAVQG